MPLCVQEGGRSIGTYLFKSESIIIEGENVKYIRTQPQPHRQLLLVDVKYPCKVSLDKQKQPPYASIP